MKDDLKEILYMGLGAISLTGEKASELKHELLEKGETLYKEGAIKNEELKRDIKEKIKENTNIEYAKLSKEDLIDIIKDLDEDDKKEIMDELRKNCDCKKDGCKKEDCKKNEEKNESKNEDKKTDESKEENK